MAKTYTPVGWEDGIVKTPAMADLATGEVTPPKIEGGTSVCAENLNHMDDAIKELYDDGIANITDKILNANSNSTENTYSCDYINKLNTYQIDEQQIGWYEKEDSTKVPLYRKIIRGNTPLVTTNGTTANQNYTIGSDIELSFIEFGFVHVSGLGQATIPYMSDNGNFVKAIANKNTLTIFSNNTSFGNRPFNISVLYIKGEN